MSDVLDVAAESQAGSPSLPVGSPGANQTAATSSTPTSGAGLTRPRPDEGPLGVLVYCGDNLVRAKPFGNHYMCRCGQLLKAVR